MAGDERWYFTKEEINNSPSRRCGIDAEKELSYRQQGAKLIQDMGQRLHVTQLVINTAIVYMHRFYMFHPFTKFHRNSIGPAALFLAAKVEEQPRKLEHVIKIAHYILGHHEHTNLDTQSETYMEKAQELVMNENILLQTLGFDVAIDHPHTHVVKCFQMVHNTTELAQTSYFMATNSLHMTTMCLQYKPAVVACVCIYIVCKWSNYEIQRFTEGRDWFFHVDSTVTLEMLDVLTTEFLAVLQKCPSRLKKLMNPGSHGGSSSNNIGDERSRHGSLPMTMNMRPQSIGGSSSSMRTHDISKSVSAKVMNQQAGPSKTVLSHKEYSEKKEKERRERERAEHRVEKHSLAPLNSSGSFSLPSVHIGSSNAVSAPLPSHTSHLRPQPAPDPAVNRKPHTDNNRQPMVHSTSRAPVQGPAFKEPLSVKRESVPSSRSSAVYDVKQESTERTSESAGSVKYSVEKSSDHRHAHGGEWPHSRHLEFTKDSKTDINIKSEFKAETKMGLKEVSRPVENKDIKSEPSSKALENIVIPKVEPGLKVKIGKAELKDDSKPTLAMDDIKHNNSVFFDNSDFSMRDLLNPSAMPPDEIFDDDNDLETKPMLDFSNLMPAETTHHKLKSPPKPTSHGSQLAGVPTPTTSAPSKGATVTSCSGYSALGKSVDSSHSTNDCKTSTKYSTSSSTVTSTYSTYHPTQDKAQLGNGLTAASLLPPPSHHSLSIPLVRKKDKSRSPHGPSGKTKHPSAPSDANPVLKVEEPKSHSVTKDPSFSSSQVVAKEHQQIPASATQHRSGAPISTTVKLDKVPSAGTGVTPTGVPHSLPAPKPASVPLEPPKHDTSLSIRLPCTIKSDPPSAAPPAGLVSHLGSPQVSVGDANAVQGVVSSGSSSSKKHKRDRVPHKHKEKKKHKHKDKDKCKDKESKEHKEHKSKRYKKHKEKKERRDEKCPEKLTPGLADPVAPSLPLKIILRTKGVYPHEAGTGATAVSRALAADPVSAPTQPPERDPPPPSCEASLGRIKLTIPKSRIQGNAPPVGRTPGLSPPRDSSVATTKVKLKLQRPDRESRKRDRSPSDGLHFVKIPRTSAATTASSVPPQVLDPARWSSQRH